MTPAAANGKYINAPGTKHDKRFRRAELYFALYCALGADRSLRRVVEMCSGTGARIAESTLFNYSSEYEWVRRSGEYDEEREGNYRLDDILRSDVAHAANGRLFQDIAVKFAKKLLTPEGEAVETAEMTPLEMARFLDVGTKIERLATGRATEMREVLVGVYDVVGVGFANLWVRSMDAAMAELRRAGVDERTIQRARDQAAILYGPEADRLMDQHFRRYGIVDAVVVPQVEGEE